MNPNRTKFNVYIFWQDPPDNIATLIHQPDTTGWNAPTSSLPQDTLSVPVTSGVYTGNIDRTISFRALDNGVIGVTPKIRLYYEIITEEQWSNTLDLGTGAGYTAGTPVSCVFKDRAGETLDLGLRLTFSNGLVDSNGVFAVGMEDFEGFHVWRGLESDGSDLVVVGEVSKEEAFQGTDLDSLYFNHIIPALRATGRYTLPFAVEGFGDEIDIRDIHPNGRLGPDELVWFDLNAFNGFTYYYTVTTFDRGYDVNSHAQGLFKFDNCLVSQGVPYECPQYLLPVRTRVTPQNQLIEIYAVPNPYRSGSTQYTTENYHNFPDNKMRFVNVPANCTLTIFTLHGDLIWQWVNTGGTGTIEWDTRNYSGNEVVSGVYIYRVQADEGGDMYGRIVIIR